MIYENLFAQECKPDGYQPPRTVRTAVEAEGSFCATVTSGEPATLDEQNTYIEVEEYSSVDNEVAFN